MANQEGAKAMAKIKQQWANPEETIATDDPRLKSSTRGAELRSRAELRSNELRSNEDILLEYGILLECILLE